MTVAASDSLTVRRSEEENEACGKVCMSSKGAWDQENRADFALVICIFSAFLRARSRLEHLRLNFVVMEYSSCPSC